MHVCFYYYFTVHFTSYLFITPITGKANKNMLNIQIIPK